MTLILECTKEIYLFASIYQNFKKRKTILDISLHLQEKNRKDRIAAAISKLNGSLKFWLGVQSMDKEVLKNIERQNIKLDVMTGLAVSYSKLGLPSFSEIIICLPGETLESHLNSLSKLLDSGIGAITTYNLMLLNGTER